MSESALLHDERIFFSPPCASTVVMQIINARFAAGNVGAVNGSGRIACCMHQLRRALLVVNSMSTSGAMCVAVDGVRGARIITFIEFLYFWVSPACASLSVADINNLMRASAVSKLGSVVCAELSGLDPGASSSWCCCFPLEIVFSSSELPCFFFCFQYYSF